MKIKTEELIQQIKKLLNEEFVAEIINDEDIILLRFTNGQIFKLTIKEMA
ncbi:MAG: hypothetical protein IJF64_00695 [Clostridia bacterium]|nr:hypothetical protein [Clostridia bacterium]